MLLSALAAERVDWDLRGCVGGDAESAVGGWINLHRIRQKSGRGHGIKGLSVPVPIEVIQLEFAAVVE